MPALKFNIRDVPFETLYHYREQIFPDCLCTGSSPPLSMENPDYWVTSDSLRLFMRYNRSSRPPASLRSRVDVADIRAYRLFILPRHIVMNPFFATSNADAWVSWTHLEAFLQVLDVGDEDSYPSIASDHTNKNGSVDDDVASQCSDSEDSESIEANCSHLELVGFPESSPMVIRRSDISSSSSPPTTSTYEIYPNVDLFMNLYLGDHKHYRRQTFPAFYKGYQPTYAVPSTSSFARNFVRREAGMDTNIRDHQYPERYRADLLDDAETFKGFMAMARAASKELEIRDYRW